MRREGILTELSRDKDTRRARLDFWEYLKLIDPGFFREDRPHLRALARALQDLWARKLTGPDGAPIRRLMVNLPPRMGKSYTLTLFHQWVLGRNPREKIISVSYNEILAGRFSKSVRDGIAATRAEGTKRIFSDVFPGIAVKKGDASARFWAIEGQPMSFLGAGFGGTITGVGCSVGVIDDPIKNHLEAADEARLDAQFDWYNDTFFSRLEEDAIEIIVMTRWATKDLCGRLLSREPEKWQVLKMPACLDEAAERMLCPELLSFARWRRILKTTSPEVAMANYQQQPLDIKGRMYDHFTKYQDVPRDEEGAPAFEKILCYADTADTGADYLCAVIAGLREGRLWVLDVLYTDAGMEVTEPALCDMLFQNRVDEAFIESNNGGRGFARNVERLLWERHRFRGVRMIPKAQRTNKMARILVSARYVADHVQMPEDWMGRWGAFYRAMVGFQRKGANRHDDAPDAVTGLAEIVTATGTRSRFISGRGRT